MYLDPLKKKHGCLKIDGGWGAAFFPRKNPEKKVSNTPDLGAGMFLSY